MGNLRSEEFRLGQVGNTGGKWDNGFYTKGFIRDIPLLVLIDNGSTCSLLSRKKYLQIAESKETKLEDANFKLFTANGNPIKLYGSLREAIILGDSEYTIELLVGDIQQDAILGQDFLLEHIDRIDYRKQLLTSKDTEIKCWIGGEAKMTCRVISKYTVTIPPRSKMYIEVDVENAQYLADFGLVDNHKNLEKDKGVYLTRGVLDPHQKQVHIQMTNFKDETVTIFTQEYLGDCESYYEEEAPIRGTCNRLDLEQREITEGKLPEHLTDLWNRSSIHLNQEEKQKLTNLLIKYQDVFSRSADDLGRTDRILHRVNTGTAAPIRQHARRLPLGKKEIEKAEIQKMLARDVIEPSKSPWSSPVVLVTKRDGSTRFCIDYRRVNEVLINDAFGIPRTDECLDSLAGGKWFACLDLNQGFFQVLLHPDDREKTAFITSQGLYQFKVTPFGLANSPSTFERLMEDVLRGLQWSECLLYIDDIIIPGPTIEESLTRLEHVFERLREANLKLKPSKCVLFQKSVKFLGHIVSEEGIHTDPEKVKAVQDWPVPRNVKEVKSFLGLCSYYRKFVQGFADIARPMHHACKKGTKFTWTETCQQSFDKLKQALTSPPILIYPIPGKQFILDTDASNFAVGAVLSQEVDGKEHVIAYMSKALHKHEISYCTTRKELLAVVTALKNFHPYLYGQKVILRTDNAAVSG